MTPSQKFLFDQLTHLQQGEVMEMQNLPSHFWFDSNPGANFRSARLIVGDVADRGLIFYSTHLGKMEVRVPSDKCIDVQEALEFWRPMGMVIEVVPFTSVEESEVMGVRIYVEENQ